MAERSVIGPFFQVGVLVQDIEASRDELGRALGLSWTDIVDRDVTDDWKIRICFSREGPPYIELVEGPPGSPWDCTDGSRIDHIGYFAPEIARNKSELEAAGIPVEVDGTKLGGVFTYQRGRDSGLRVELIDAGGRDAFYERWGLEKPEQ